MEKMKRVFNVSFAIEVIDTEEDDLWDSEIQDKVINGCIDAILLIDAKLPKSKIQFSDDGIRVKIDYVKSGVIEV